MFILICLLANGINRKIPDDILRPHANLKAILRSRAYNYAKEVQATKDIKLDDLKKNTQEPFSQYLALQYLANNKYKLKVITL